MSETIIVRRPGVARDRRKASNLSIAIVCGALGLGAFSSLALARASREDSALPTLLNLTSTPAPDTAAPKTEGTASAQPVTTPYFNPKQSSVTLVPTLPTSPTVHAFTGLAQPTRAPHPGDNMQARMAAPTLVVDMTRGGPPQKLAMATQLQSDSGAIDERGVRVTTTTGGNFVPTTTVGVTTGGAVGSSSGLNDSERFAQRVGGEEVEVARARQMVGLDRMVPQGAVMGAVMETALNSDQPGFARAMVQRDVFSFDGSAVLIPAGSRVIGQYKSGVAQGASRVFVLWTRLIRPDGVSIDLASPATDDLGRGGLGGKVNRHFFQRFGGAILTSVFSGAINAAAAAASGGSTILVGSAGQASSLASEASRGGDIPPTITTRQGAPVRIFVARDLDFSLVGPAK
ncbi:MAG: TrbI/VirB10 family protein [Sphingomicrobium sp.]